MLVEVDTVKGFQDYLPPESVRRRFVKEIIEKHFKLYGFLPIETPVIEFDEIMKPDNLEPADEAVSDRFRLRDRGGRNLGLRYEFTFQLSRIFKQNPNIKLPFKRYQIGEVFRDEPIGPGRFRQFTQCDADVVGESSVDSDAELLAMLSDIVKELGIEARICVNNRKLINSLIESVQIGDVNQVMRELDKLDKIGEDLVKANLKKFADTNQVITLFKLLEKDLSFFISNAFDGAAELEQLEKKCRQYGVKIFFTPSMIRGLGYYTGNIFEVKQNGGNITIAAGGRYDRVVGKYVNREIPAVGISFGLERVSDLAKVNIPDSIVASVISLNRDSQMRKLAKALRTEGINCITSSGKPGKALEYANSLKIPYVIFIGDEEVAKKKFKLKNMVSGEEKYLSEKQVINVFVKHIKSGYLLQ
ncbi:histidine--tRNA ligase [Candidatus Pacearchaeota archaeon]|nr:histidine--tRNA ligase [Candidatus Pacearchaeota archaeon]